ncbi:MAG: hypothetical protein ACK4NQ_02840 [Fimbriimonadaceae bacterium]
MAIGNVECHLARAQLKRLGQGEQLPTEIDADLERHLRICEECRLEAVRLRQVLMGDAAPAEPKAKVNPSELLLQLGEVVRNLISRLPLPGAKRLAPSKSNGWMNDPGTPFVKDSRVNMRVAFTSIGLALTLIAMSTILRDPTALLGAKAGTKATAQKESKESTESEKDGTTSESEEAAKEDAAKDEHAEDEKADEHATDEHAAEEHAADTHGEQQHAEDVPTDDEHADKMDDAHAESDSHAAAPKTNSSSSTHPPRQQNGLSLPGQPTMEDAPILKARDGQVVPAQRSTPAPTRTHRSTTNSQRRSRPSSSATRRPAPTRPAPSRPAPRPASTPRPQSNSGTPQNKVTVYLPNGEKKN